MLFFTRSYQVSSASLPGGHYMWAKTIPDSLRIIVCLMDCMTSRSQIVYHLPITHQSDHLTVNYHSCVFLETALEYEGALARATHMIQGITRAIEVRTQQHSHHSRRCTWDIKIGT